MSGGQDRQRRLSAWFRPVVPPPRFARTAGQPDRSSPTAIVPLVTRLRWVRCPGEGQLHLLSPVEIAVATTHGYAHALYERGIPAGALTLTGRSVGLCVSCLAAGTGTGS